MAQGKTKHKSKGKGVQGMRGVWLEGKKEVGKSHKNILGVKGGREGENKRR